MATEKMEKVLANMAQGLSAAEQKQARENIGISGIPAQFSVMRKSSDSASAPRYVKVAELTPGISENYTYHYDLSFLVTGSTGRGDGEQGESGQFDLNITCRKNTNVYYANGTWSNFDGIADLTSPYRNVESVILMEQFKDNAPYADDLTKVEVWLKVTNNLSYMQNLSVSILVNQGDRQYTSSYPSKAYMGGPWEVSTGSVWLTTTAPTGDDTAPNSYRLTEFQAAPTEVAQVNADWDATSGVAEILNKPYLSETKKLDYGGQSATHVSTLLFDNDDPEGYSLVKADGVTQGCLVQGPYKGLLDSGINGGSGKGDSTTPLYIDSNGTFQTCSAFPAGVFIAYWSGYSTGHDNTTFAEIKAAYDAGQAVFMYNTISGGDVWRVLDTIDSNRAIFSRTSGAVTGGNFGNIVSSIVYVESSDDSYHYMDCPLQPELTPGYRISIGPGANDTTVIANTMHESVFAQCASWDTLANNYDLDYYWGNWRCHVHLKAFSDWADCGDAIHIRLSHVYANEQNKIKAGSYQVQTFHKYKSVNTYDSTNTHWLFTGEDPYTTTTTPDPYGFAFHLLTSAPMKEMPAEQVSHRFLLDTGGPYGEWLELEASVRFFAANAQPSSNGIYLLLKGKYAYSYT
jgi:hypothetical protein